MKVINRISGACRLAKLDVELSREAQKRLKWFDYYRSHGENARLTCRYFGISPQTFYRWKRRYDPKHLESLEDKSCRPQHIRQPTTPPELVEAVLKLREERPRWGREAGQSLAGRRLPGIQLYGGTNYPPLERAWCAQGADT